MQVKGKRKRSAVRSHSEFQELVFRAKTVLLDIMLTWKLIVRYGVQNMFLVKYSEFYFVEIIQLSFILIFHSRFIECARQEAEVKLFCVLREQDLIKEL